MVRNSLRITRLLGWRYLRWAITIPTVPLVWWACTSHPLTQPNPTPETQTNLYIPVSPVRQLDMVFMIDNSPSMAPKQQKLKDNFPLLLKALQDPTNGNALPDLRVAIIDSDLGTGGAIPSGNCGPNASNGQSLYGDVGKFRMINTTAANPTPCGANPGAQWLEYSATAGPVNFTGDINQVFACLAGNLGTQGCGFEHQLQAFEFALTNLWPDNTAQLAMLRPTAYLGLVFLSDEDDCSAAINDGMFSSLLNTTLANESASLRCSTRAHQCGGTSPGNYLTNPPPGYPTTGAYTHAFSDCSARTDSCPNYVDGNNLVNGKNSSAPYDTSVPTDCSPLRDIHNLAQVIKGLKTDPDQILVAGIYGWPLDGDMPKAQYKIDKIYSQNPAIPTPIYDYWPVCYDPNHPLGNNDPTTADGYAASVAYGATGGLRMNAFVNEFGANGFTYSICQPDFATSLQDIGTKIAAKLQNLCVKYKLLDINPPNQQFDCHVAYSVPDAQGVYKEQSTSMPRCDPNQSDANQPAFPCWKLVKDTTKCPGDSGAGVGQLINVVRKPGDAPLAAGTKVDMSCRTCVDSTQGPTNPSGAACSY
jgi:hypothetical protein